MQVDFYILPTGDQQQWELFIGRLVRKVYRLQQSLAIHVPDLATAQHWQALLWSFETDSFLPHGIDQPQLPINLTMQPADASVCVNLCSTIADGFVGRCLEVIDGSADALAQGRQKFKCYQDAGHVLKTHKL